MSAKTTRAEDKLRAFHEESVLGKAYDSRLIRRLWPFVAPHKRYLVISFGVLLVMTALNLARPLLMGAVVRHGGERNADALLRSGILLALVVLGTQSLTFLQTFSMQLAGARAMADLRRHVFRFMQGLTLRYFDRTPVGRLVTRASGDVDAVGELFVSGVLNAAGDLLALTGIVVVMLRLNVKLSLIAFASLPFVLMVVSFVRKRSREAFRDIRTKTARLNSFLNEQVSGISVVQAFARESAMAAEFDVINEEYRDANKRSIFYEAVLDAAIEMISTICIASILFWAGFSRVGGDVITFATIVTFTQYIRQFFEPVSMLAQRYTTLQSAMAGAERIFQLLDVTDRELGAGAPNAATADMRSPATTDEAVVFSHVDFSYKDNAPVLNDVTVTIKKGERVALVGATGAGKSTVASLVLRLYEPGSGQIRVFGKDIREQDPVALRRLFSVVPQDVFLFGGTILSNLSLTFEGADRTRAEDALRRVGAGEILRERGLDGEVEERGTNFSSGERQLLAFARALYRNAPILILDEATASIDSDTEAKLQTAVDVVMADRTAIVIAHRLSTIQKLDRIIVFHKGRIVEEGSHATLLALGGVYARLHRLHLATH